MHVVSKTNQRNGSRYYTNFRNGNALYFHPHRYVRLAFSAVATLVIRTRYTVRLKVGRTSHSPYTPREF